MSLIDSEPIPRRTMVLFFIVDTSGSMSGSKMGSVNTTVHEILPELKDISAENADAQIKIAVLEFSSGARWLYDKPMEADNFCWNDLHAGGVTDLGEACKMLNQKLSRNQFMQDAVGSFAPVIILLSDGEPTDNYKKELDVLKGNNWFKAAIKIAIAIGEDANQEILREFTGNVECVVIANNPSVLKKIIRFASVSASQIGSRSTNAGVESKQEEMGKQLQYFVKEDLPTIQDTKESPVIDTQEW
jgi:uncharacterized protein YegL